MANFSKLGVWTGTATLVGSLGLFPALPATAAEIEEVVVTGSYIKRDSFDSSSPITVVDQTAIAENATPNLGEVLVNQTFNYGSDFQTNTYAARPQIGNLTAANLRGLGAGATLDLFDSRRSIAGNLNNSIPQIAVERIEILKDGASAIYGTDAVAGVVNLIPRKNFSGSKFNFFYTRDGEDTLDEQSYEFLAGSDTDDGHFTMALGYKKRGDLQQVERPQYLTGGFERSTTGNPGRWRVPSRTATGAFAAQPLLRVDPGCGRATADSPGGTNVGVKGNFLAGEISSANPSAANCNFHFGEFWNFMNPQEQFSVWGNYQFQFSDNLSNEIEIVGSRLITDSRGSPQNPGGRTEEFPIVLGDHPGNPFRAFADLNSNGVIDAGEHLFALDANADGVPDRGTADANGDGVPDVLLSPTPFNPATGIAFNEDVDVVALRIFGKIGLLPGANQPTSLNADGSNTGNASFDSLTYRVVDSLTYTVPDSSWEINLTGIYERIHTILENKNTSQSALTAGLRGELKADPTDATTSFWNPFATQAMQCVDRVCTFTGTPGFANTVAVLDAINIQSHDVTDTSFWTAQLLATGDVIELPGGMVGGAFGIEYRKTEIEADIDSGRNQCDWHEGGCQFDYQAKQDVYSAFFELAVPIIDNMEAQVAARYTDYGAGIGDSFDPKIGILWQPIDVLSIRATYSTAFIAPNLEQLFEPEDCGLQTFGDPVTNDNSGTFRVACVSGNQSLTPESADIFNVGFSLSLLDDDLTIGVDYAEYDFEDRISITTGNQVVSADFAAFLASGGNANPTSGDADGDGISDSAEAWINGPLSDPAIQRDPTTGILSRVRTSRVNSQEMLHRAVDVYGRYNLSLNRAGDFIFNLGVTQALEYSYDLGTGAASGVGDGVGFQNEQISEVPPMPEFRANAGVNWFLGNHAAAIRLRWMDGITLQFNTPALLAAQIAINGTDQLEDMLYTDINYKYTFPSLLGQRETTIELGANNVFDELPTPFFNLGGAETFLHDLRGRMMYVRLSQDL